MVKKTSTLATFIKEKDQWIPWFEAMHTCEDWKYDEYLAQTSAWMEKDPSMVRVFEGLANAIKNK